MKIFEYQLFDVRTGVPGLSRTQGGKHRTNDAIDCACWGPPLWSTRSRESFKWCAKSLWWNIRQVLSKDVKGRKWLLIWHLIVCKTSGPIWELPEIGVPPVVIHFCPGFSMKKTIQLWGYPHDYGQHHVLIWLALHSNSACRAPVFVAWSVRLGSQRHDSQRHHVLLYVELQWPPAAAPVRSWDGRGKCESTSTHTHTHARAHTRAHTHARTHTRTHTHTHTHTLDKKLIHHRISWELNPIHAKPNKTKKKGSPLRSIQRKFGGGKCETHAGTSGWSVPISQSQTTVFVGQWMEWDSLPPCRLKTERKSEGTLVEVLHLFRCFTHTHTPCQAAS